MTEPAKEMEWLPVWKDLLKFEVKDKLGMRVDIEIWDDDEDENGGLLAFGRTTKRELLESYRD